MEMSKRIVSMVMVVTFILSLGPMPSAMALRPGQAAGNKEEVEAIGRAIGGVPTVAPTAGAITGIELKNEIPARGRNVVGGAFYQSDAFAAIVGGTPVIFKDSPGAQTQEHVLSLATEINDAAIAKLGLNDPENNYYRRYYVYHDREADLTKEMKPTALVFSPDGTEMVSSDGEVMTRVGLTDGEPHTFVNATTYHERPDGSPISRGINDLTYLPSGDILFASTGWCEVGVWKKDGTIEALRRMPKEAFNLTGPYGVAYDTARAEVMATNGHAIIIFPLGNPENITAEIPAGKDKDFLHAAYTPDGKYIIATYQAATGNKTEGWQTGIRVISRETLKPVLDKKIGKYRYIVKVTPEPSGEGFLLTSGDNRHDITRYAFTFAAAPAAGERVLVVGDARELKEFIASNAQEHSVKISIDVLPEATDEQIKTYDLVIKKTDVGYQLISAAGAVTATYTSLPEVETAIDKQMGTWA